MRTASRPARFPAPSSAQGQRRRALRRGVTVLELVLWLPVAVILLLAVIEFGLIEVQLNQVALAARVGARTASRQTAGAFDVAAIQSAVDLHLTNAELGSSCRVILAETVTAAVPTLYDSGGCPCTSPTDPLQPVNTVRVTVAVPLSQLAPNLLAMFGFDLTGRRAVVTTTFPHEP